MDIGKKVKRQRHVDGNALEDLPHHRLYETINIYNMFEYSAECKQLILVCIYVTDMLVY